MATCPSCRCPWRNSGCVTTPQPFDFGPGGRGWCTTIFGLLFFANLDVFYRKNLLLLSVRDRLLRGCFIPNRSWPFIPYQILLIVLWVLFVARTLAQGKLALPIRPVKVYLIFLGIWFAYAIISLGWTASKGDAIRHLIFLFMGVSLIFFASYYFRSLPYLHMIYWIWLTVFCVLVLLGFWEHLTGCHLPVSGFHEERLQFLKDYVIARVKNVSTGVFRTPTTTLHILH